jgi:hypothetical protein
LTARAATLEAYIKLASSRELVGCRHSYSPDRLEMANANKVYVMAGLIRLYRAALWMEMGSDEVQIALETVVWELYMMKQDGSRHACLWFTAGCEALEDFHRSSIMRRMEHPKHLGLSQVMCFFELTNSVY